MVKFFIFWRKKRSKMGKKSLKITFFFAMQLQVSSKCARKMIWAREKVRYTSEILNFVILKIARRFEHLHARLRARNLMKYSKNARKSYKNFVNKRPWKFFKCFGHVFHSFVTCKVFWSDLILVTNIRKVSPINVICSENVIFKCFDTVWKLSWS